MTQRSTQEIKQQVNQWLDDVVIGLNLCPFAAKPQRNKQIKIHVSDADSEETLLQDILTQLLELDQSETERVGDHAGGGAQHAGRFLGLQLFH